MSAEKEINDAYTRGYERGLRDGGKRPLLTEVPEHVMAAYLKEWNHPSYTHKSTVLSVLNVYIAGEQPAPATDAIETEIDRLKTELAAMSFTAKHYSGIVDRVAVHVRGPVSGVSSAMIVCEWLARVTTDPVPAAEQTGEIDEFAEAAFMQALDAKKSDSASGAAESVPYADASFAKARQQVNDAIYGDGIKEAFLTQTGWDNASRNALHLMGEALEYFIKIGWKKRDLDVLQMKWMEIRDPKTGLLRKRGGK